ncbi:hypothetical protein [Streptomyces sp. NPDC127098]|uniref:hypothetical protein n=1 Tax=Streptomyces sp. NPDC127098 TaxID=3347137 RepID=UPI00364632D1
MLRLGWIAPTETIPIRFGTSRAGAVDVALYTTATIDALPTTHPDIDWQQLRSIGKGRRSPLAALQPTNPTLAPA